MDNVVKIRDWSVVGYNWIGYRRDPDFTEFKNLEIGNSLHGKVNGHPRVEDGHRAHTSKIVSIGDDNRIVTQSGTVYQLMSPLPAYIDWMNEQMFKIFLDGAATDNV